MPTVGHSMHALSQHDGVHASSEHVSFLRTVLSNGMNAWPCRQESLKAT